MNTENDKKINWISASAILTTDPSSDPPSGNPPAGDPPAGDPPPDGGTPPADGDNGTGDGSPKDGDTPTGAPESYADFTLPEGVTVDAELLGEFTPIAKELNLTQDQAQKLVDLQAKAVQKMTDGMYAMFEQRKVDWLKAAQEDAEIGEDVKLGDQSAALRAFNTITKGDEKAKQMVDELGIGNHPEFIRIFHRIAKQMREDSFEFSGTGGATRSVEEQLYPSMAKK